MRTAKALIRAVMSEASLVTNAIRTITTCAGSFDVPSQATLGHIGYTCISKVKFICKLNVKWLHFSKLLLLRMVYEG